MFLQTGNPLKIDSFNCFRNVSATGPKTGYRSATTRDQQEHDEAVGHSRDWAHEWKDDTVQGLHSFE